MSRQTVIIALLPTLLLGFVCAYLYSELQRERELARTQNELRSDLQERIAVLDATRSQLEHELVRLRAASNGPAPNGVPRLGNAPDAIPAETTSMTMPEVVGQPMGLSAAQREWMTSPIARDLMRSHQRDWIRRSNEDLFALLELSPEEAEALIALMADAQTPGIELGTTRPIDPATLENMRNKMDEQRRKTDEAIREMLGEEKYRKYQDYRNSETERIQIAELQRLFEATPTPLRAEQSAQLLAALIEERGTAAPWTRGPTMPTAEEVQRYQQWAQDYQLRVEERIASLLSPEQLERYNAFRRMQAAMRSDGIAGGVAIQGGVAFSSSAVAIPE